MKKVLPFMLFLFYSWCYATNYDFYGWSSNGRYLAFAQHGFGGDGDETAFTELFIIDSHKNKIVQRYFKLANQPGEGRIGLLNMLALYKQAAPLLKRLGISEKRQGTVIWQKKVPEVIWPEPTGPDVFPKQIPERPNMVSAQQFSALKGQWQFRLAQIPYGTKIYDCPPLANYTRGFLLEISSKVNSKSVITTVLQEDARRVPKSRACTFHYEPVEVRVQGQYISVTLATYRSAGFEDAIDRSFIVITGQKPKTTP